jgi:hypothetical protein
MRRQGLTLALMALAVAAVWVARRSESSARLPELSPAQAVALRFAADGADRAGSLGPDRVAARQRERTMTAHLALSADSLIHTKLPDPVLAERVPERVLIHGAPAPDGAMRSTIDDTRSGAGAPPSDPAAARQAALAANRNAVLSEGQIGSIKARLKLTAEQQQYWRPVESALRALVWRRPHDRRANATLDPNGVQKLSSAAAALMAHLSQEQKREVRALAFLVGLDRVAAQF